MQRDRTKLYTCQGSIQLPLGNLDYSLTRYKNTMVIVINQGGTLGTIISGFVEKVSSQNIYDIKTLFGATDSEIYQVLFRRLIEHISSCMSISSQKQAIGLTLFISLPLKNKQFDEKMYFRSISQKLEKQISSLLPQK